MNFVAYIAFVMTASLVSFAYFRPVGWRQWVGMVSIYLVGGLVVAYTTSDEAIGSAITLMVIMNFCHFLVHLFFGHNADLVQIHDVDREQARAIDNDDGLF